MESYRLSIITPNGKIFEDQVESLIAPGVEGQFGVLAKHSPMVVSLKKGFLNLKQNEQEKYFAINAGVLEVNQGSDVLLLSDDAVDAVDKDNALEKVKSFV